MLRRLADKGNAVLSAPWIDIAALHLCNAPILCRIAQEKTAQRRLRLTIVMPQTGCTAEIQGAGNDLPDSTSATMTV